MKNMQFKDIFLDKRVDSKKFKTVTGSPIIYTKHNKHTTIYYPTAKRAAVEKPKPQQTHIHAAVVNSKTYGREVYGSIDIWPEEEIAREKLIEKLKRSSLSKSYDAALALKSYENLDIGRIKGIYRSIEDSLHTKNADDTRHVTITVTDTSEDDDTASSGGKQIHPDPNRTGSLSEEQGSWPLKRSHSIDSRDNPFLPGGDLSKEADDILKKATIIRDTFILKDENNAAKRVHEEQIQRADVKKTESENQSSANQSPVKETVIQQTVSNSENAVVPNASPAKTRPKENGQVDTENSLTPGSVALEIADDTKAKKKQQKCCIVM